MKVDETKHVAVEGNRRHVVITRPGRDPNDVLDDAQDPAPSPPSDLEVRLAALEAKAGVTKADIDAKRAEIIAVAGR
ncbi:MAG: hypothetical protein CMM50_01240 [Rhodospirillaceae bacterium]|nr:hypothetical protein [Rhodospirillaceae bacterium]